MPVNLLPRHDVLCLRRACDHLMICRKACDPCRKAGYFLKSGMKRGFDYGFGVDFTPERRAHSPSFIECRTARMVSR